MIRLTFSLILVTLLSLCYGCKQNEPAAEIKKPVYVFRNDGNLNITGKDGKLKATFQIEIVEQEDDIRRGLKFRESMAENQGMLFVFGTPGYYDFWMQDTYLPLDMLYISSDYTIFQIHENTKPFSEERIPSSQAQSYVLEINAGIAKKMNLQTDDKISWSRN